MASLITAASRVLRGPKPNAGQSLRFLAALSQKASASASAGALQRPRPSAPKMRVESSRRRRQREATGRCAQQWRIASGSFRSPLSPQGVTPNAPSTSSRISVKVKNSQAGLAVLLCCVDGDFQKRPWPPRHLRGRFTNGGRHPLVPSENYIRA